MVYSRLMVLLILTMSGCVSQPSKDRSRHSYARIASEDINGVGFRIIFYHDYGMGIGKCIMRYSEGNEFEIYIFKKETHEPYFYVWEKLTIDEAEEFSYAAKEFHESAIGLPETDYAFLREAHALNAIVTVSDGKTQFSVTRTGALSLPAELSDYEPWLDDGYTLEEIQRGIHELEVFVNFCSYIWARAKRAITINVLAKDLTL